jgi:hypothetical protein
MSKKKRLSVKDMIVCPYCRAYSYPRVFSDPQNDEEKKAIFCGSCKTDLTPYLEAMDKYMKEMEAKEKEKENGTLQEGIVLENEENTKEIFPDAEKIAYEVLTDQEE